MAKTAVQEWISGTVANNGILIKFDNETNDGYYFYSSNAATAASRPKLVIQYTLPAVKPDWVSKAYTYADAAHKHAVTSVDVVDEEDNTSTNTYEYDDNGNMTCRIEDGAAYLQSYNAENRLSGIALLPPPAPETEPDCGALVTPVKTWQFTYDGDGSRVKQVYTEGVSTLTTYYYGGGSYEVQTDGTTETVTQYYSIAGTTVAMRVGAYGDTPEEWTFFLTDHLGSVVGVTDSSGTLTGETRYLPFGEVRTGAGTAITQTDFGYTFQRVVTGSGLMDYKARMYDPYLNRWTQPDSIIPDPYNPQSWNHYTYVRNNSTNNIDPTGKKEIECDGDGNCINFQKLKSDFHKAKEWKNAGLDFDDFVIGYVSYQDLKNKPNKALKNCLDDTDEYFWADTYSEYVLHQMYQPFDEGPVKIMTEQARKDGDAKLFYGSLLWLSSGLFFESDKGFGSNASGWTFGGFKSTQKWENQMAKRGWTTEQINEAYFSGEKYSAVNNVNPGNTATRYINPDTGRSVVIDDITNEVLHIGGDYFDY